MKFRSTDRPAAPSSTLPARLQEDPRVLWLGAKTRERRAKDLLKLVRRERWEDRAQRGLVATVIASQLPLVDATPPAPPVPVVAQASRQDLAAAALARSFDPGSSMFAGHWWGNGSAASSLLDYANLTCSSDYDALITQLFDNNDGGAHAILWRFDFKNSFMDDTAWWGNALVSAYDRTGNPRYLQLAIGTVDHIWQAKVESGLPTPPWNTHESVKTQNLITSLLFIELSARVATRLESYRSSSVEAEDVEAHRAVLERSSDPSFQENALETWRFVRQSALVAGDVFHDTIDPVTGQGVGGHWTYHGAIAGAVYELSLATRDPALFDEAVRLGVAYTRVPLLHDENGILRDWSEPSGDKGNRDVTYFKGPFLRALGKLHRALEAQGRESPFGDYLQRQLAAADANRTPSGDFGWTWFTPDMGHLESGELSSGLDLLNAVDGWREVPADPNAVLAASTQEEQPLPRNGSEEPPAHLPGIRLRWPRVEDASDSPSEE